ncbi:MAG: hypothetical protein ACT4O1_03170 [Gemmatimonadota bacterium]
MKVTRRSLCALLLLASGIAACERIDDVQDLAGPTPQRHNAAAVAILKRNDNASSNTCSAAIDSRGGVFSHDAYTLTIPANAVSVATTFCIKVHEGDKMKVDLNAYVDNKRVTQFDQPVMLSISYKNTAYADAARVFVVYHNYGAGTLDPLSSTMDSATQVVSAWLWHFSDYSPATD